MISDLYKILIDYAENGKNKKLQLAAKEFLLNPSTIGWTTEVKLVKIHDADTMRVAIERILDVRLIDCFMPELNRGTAESKQIARLVTAKVRMLLEKADRIFLTIPKESDMIKDIFTFGRVLGHLYCLVEDEIYNIAEYANTSLKEITNE